MSKNSTGNTVHSDQTDWSRVAAMKDEDIALDESNPRTTDADWGGAVMNVGEQLIGHVPRRGKQRGPTKVSTTVRFDPEVLAAFKDKGKGWQTRMNDALKEWLATH